MTLLPSQANGPGLQWAEPHTDGSLLAKASSSPSAVCEPLEIPKICSGCPHSWDKRSYLPFGYIETCTKGAKAIMENIAGQEHKSQNVQCILHYCELLENKKPVICNILDEVLKIIILFNLNLWVNIFLLLCGRVVPLTRHPGVVPVFRKRTWETVLSRVLN